MVPPPSSQAVQQAILQALYALFLGGIITACVVVAVTTFSPQPSFEEQLRPIEEREQEILDCPAQQQDCPLTPAQQAELDRLQEQREEVWDQQQAADRQWSRNAGIVLIAVATALLGLSLIRWDAAIVLSNGLMIGGLFTMVGGIGFTIAGGSGVERFLVLLLAVAITVGLGLVRFARRGGAPSGTPGAGVPPATDLEARVAVLEAKLQDLRRALGG